MRILEFDEVASTNTLASEMLERGELTHGDAITARHQTAGRGRSAGRTWNDAPGESLLMSIVLTQIPEPVHLLQYRAALAVLEALRAFSTGDSPNNEFLLKWPNDILLNRKKVCGVLLEAQWNGASMRSAVVGIGVNVRQRLFPSELAEIATSLSKSGIDISVETVRDKILASFNANLAVSTVADVLSLLQTELRWMTQLPTLEATEGNHHYTDVQFEGIEESGAARLRDAAGALILVRNGSLSWNKSNG